MSRRKASASRPPRTRGAPTVTGGIGLPLWKQRRFLLALGCVALVIVSLWYWRFESAGAYFRQAQLHFALDPSAAEPLAEQAVIRAGGNYPAAQLLQCRSAALCL